MNGFLRRTVDGSFKILELHLGESGLLAKLAAEAFRLGDTGAQFCELVLQLKEPLTAFFLLSLMHLYTADEGVVAFLILADSGFEVAALLAQHGLGGRA
jgi:hypothetical protein